MTASRETSRWAGSVVRRDRMKQLVDDRGKPLDLCDGDAGLFLDHLDVVGVGDLLEAHEQGGQGVRRLVRASEAKSRSAASDLASCWALRGEDIGDPVDLGDTALDRGQASSRPAEPARP